MLLRTDAAPTAPTAALSQALSSVSHHALLMWLLYASVALVLLALSTFLVRYFQPRDNASSNIRAFAATSTISAAPLQISSKFVNVVCIFALYLSLLCLFTAPVDVYLLENTLPEVNASAEAVKTLYMVYFTVLAAYSFIGAPLVYNYAKQTEIAHLTLRFAAKQRFAAALKRTACFFVGFSLVLLMAMVVLLCGKPVSSDVEWLKPLLKLSTDLEMLLRLLIGILVLFGLYLWILVASRGLASVPVVGLLMEDHGSDESRSTFEELLHENALEAQATTQSRETLLHRYAVARQQLSVADKDRLAQLQLRERVLAERRAVLDANLKQFTLGTRLACWKIPLGVLLLALSLLALSSLLLTSIDKMLHASYSSGFVLNAPLLPNPLDLLLVLASEVFPLDYVLFGVLFLYIFLVSFVVLARHGLRLLCFRMDRIQPRLTAASTMAVVSLVMIYMAIVGLFSTLTLAPQYATFGHQVFVDAATGRVLPCTLAEAAASEAAAHAAGSDVPAHCRMTQLAHFFNTLAVSVPLFGAAMFAGQLLFVFAFFPWLAHAYSMARALPDTDPKRERLLGKY